jgi:flagellar biosynthesis protein FlhG
MYDQANELRQLVSQRTLAPGRPPAGPKLLVVAGGKGGVGTTSVAIHLAVALAQGGFHPVLVDADVDGGNTALLCGIQERYTIADALAGRRTVQESLEMGPAGIRILAGAWELAVLADGSTSAQQRLIGQLQGLHHLTEIVVIDVGNSWSRWARRFWQAADRVLLVTTPELASIMDAYASIKLLAAGEPGIPLELVVNRAADAAAEEVATRLTRACQRFLGIRLGVAGYVPDDAQIMGGASEHELIGSLVSASPLTLQLRQLAETLAQRIGLTAVRQLSAAS